MGDLKNAKHFRTVAGMALPYASYTHPESTASGFVTGSQDVMTSAKGYCERRPGFSNTLETTPTTFNNLQRLFTWNRFDGTFVQMACDINASGFAVVYKRLTLTENSFSSIFTDSSGTPFDFVVSNNTVYFSNGNVAKKYDPVNGVTNWGIAIGSVNNASGPDAPTAAATFGDAGTTAWTNPGNIEVEDGSFATNTSVGPSGPFADRLQGTAFGFSIPASTTVTGIQVDVKGLVAFTGSQGGTLSVQLLKGGSPTGNVKSVSLPSSNGFVTAGGTSDLWGTTFTANDINQTTFGVLLGTHILNVAGNANWSIDFVRVTVFGIGGPSIVVSGSAGSLSATQGYQYVFTYGSSNSGHVSSPSPVSASTGIFTNKLNVQVSLTASTDPQVNQIHVYRSTDSVPTGAIAGSYFELPNSPFSNTNQNVLDTAADTALNINSIAPVPGFNDPPTPGLMPTYFSGRIWMFKNNQVVYSGLEEITTGVPEESFPSGLAGNFWNFDLPVTALAVAGQSANQGLLIFSAGKIYGISGNSLYTFRRFLVTDRRGTTSRTNVSSLGGNVAWIDTAKQIWFTDGSNTQEVGVPIRTDLKAVDMSKCSLTFHTSGEAHWLVVSTGTQLFIGDMDLAQWMPPWSFSCNTISSFQASSGNVVLAAATTTKALTLNQSGIAGTFNDSGSTYQPILVTALKPLVPDFNVYSTAYGEIASMPARTGRLVGLGINTNNNILGGVSVLTDDDPTAASSVFTSITDKLVTPQVALNRPVQGTSDVQRIYSLFNEAVGRFVSVQIEGANADDNLRIYSMYYAIEPASPGF